MDGLRKLDLLPRDTLEFRKRAKKMLETRSESRMKLTILAFSAKSAKQG